MTVVGHIAIDTIVSDNSQIISLGGPPSYSGLTARNLGADVSLLTKYGKDLPHELLILLKNNNLRISKEALSKEYPTTRFKIIQTFDKRELYLEAKCDNLEKEELFGDAALVSPIAGEVDLSLLSDIRNRFDTIYLDPQGFIRKFEPDGRCFLSNSDVNFLKYVDILKVDYEEAFAITKARNSLEVFNFLSKIGVKIVIYSNGAKGVSLMFDNSIYDIPVIMKKKAIDTTGLGDIFAGAFLASYALEDDLLWSACIGVSASSLSLGKPGLSKIPNLDEVMKLAKETKNKVKRLK